MSVSANSASRSSGTATMSLKSLRVKPTLPAPMIAILSFGIRPAPSPILHGPTHFRARVNFAPLARRLAASICNETWPKRDFLCFRG